MEVEQPKLELDTKVETPVGISVPEIHVDSPKVDVANSDADVNVDFSHPRKHSKSSSSSSSESDDDSKRFNFRTPNFGISTDAPKFEVEAPTLATVGISEKHVESPGSLQPSDINEEIIDVQLGGELECNPEFDFPEEDIMDGQYQVPDLPHSTPIKYTSTKPEVNGNISVGIDSKSSSSSSDSESDEVSYDVRSVMDVVQPVYSDKDDDSSSSSSENESDDESKGNTRGFGFSVDNIPLSTFDIDTCTPHSEVSDSDIHAPISRSGTDSATEVDCLDSLNIDEPVDMIKGHSDQEIVEEDIMTMDAVMNEESSIDIIPEKKVDNVEFSFELLDMSGDETDNNIEREIQTLPPEELETNHPNLVKASTSEFIPSGGATPIEEEFKENTIHDHTLTLEEFHTSVRRKFPLKKYGSEIIHPKVELASLEKEKSVNKLITEFEQPRHVYTPSPYNQKVSLPGLYKEHIDVETGKPGDIDDLTEKMNVNTTHSPSMRPQIEESLTPALSVAVNIDFADKYHSSKEGSDVPVPDLSFNIGGGTHQVCEHIY